MQRIVIYYILPSSSSTIIKNCVGGVFVASSTLAMDSVEGQRGLPSLLRRFDLLNAVGLSFAFTASPEVDSPFREASISIAFQS